jgi:hypothetical protein
VDTPANLYAAALSNALAFYQNQRDGADFIPSDQYGRMEKSSSPLNVDK